MTSEEYINICMQECSNAAEDCKGAADYAAYEFGQGREEKARLYAARLEENVQRLKSAMGSLDYAKRREESEG